MTAQLILDNSAFARLEHPALPDARAREVLRGIRTRTLGVCLPFLLEAGFSARNATDYADTLGALLVLPRIPIDGPAEQHVLAAQAELAAAGQHRISPVDLMIAGAADRHGLGVLHYDHHYDFLREHTSLRFESVWLAPRGSL